MKETGEGGFTGLEIFVEEKKKQCIRSNKICLTKNLKWYQI